MQFGLNGKEIKWLESGRFVFGFGRDADLTQKIEWQLLDKLAHQKN